jgi:hypothetical protein
VNIDGGDQGVPPKISGRIKVGIMDVWIVIGMKIDKAVIKILPIMIYRYTNIF